MRGPWYPTSQKRDVGRPAPAFSDLAVFYAVLYVRVCRFDEPAERCGVCGCSRFELYMAHEPAGALQQAGRIGKSGSLEKTYIYMRGEDIDVGEGDVSQTNHRTAIVQNLANFVPALPHHREPFLGDGTQTPSMFAHPPINRGIPLDGTIKSQKIGSGRFR